VWDIIKPDGNFAGCVELMAPGNCFPYLNRITMEVRRLLEAKALNDQLLVDIFSIGQGIMETMSGHLKMSEVERNIKRQYKKPRIIEEILEVGEDTESVHFEMGQQQNTSRGLLGRRQEIEGNTKSVHFEMGQQQNTSRGILRGKQEVENAVQKRICGSLSSFLRFLVINL